jgi:hypothetical protein
VSDQEADADRMGSNCRHGLGQVVDIHTQRRIRDRRRVDRAVTVPAQIDGNRVPAPISEPFTELVPFSG